MGNKGGKLKVKIPQRIKVAGHWLEIQLEEGLSYRHKKLGQCDIENLVIYIEKSIPPSLQSHTLVHELLHAISDQFVGANAFSEETVGQLATGVWTMLSDLGIELDWSNIKEGK